MTGIRLTPTDKVNFPYDAVVSALRNLPGMCFEELDIPAIVAAGKRIGWPQSLIDFQWDLVKRGKCFEFNQETPPGLTGAFYETNVFFSFTSGEHEAACRPQIDVLAKTPGVSLLVQ